MNTQQLIEKVKLALQTANIVCNNEYIFYNERDHYIAVWIKEQEFIIDDSDVCFSSNYDCLLDIEALEDLINTIKNLKKLNLYKLLLEVNNDD